MDQREQEHESIWQKILIEPCMGQVTY